MTTTPPPVPPTSSGATSSGATSSGPGSPTPPGARQGEAFWDWLHRLDLRRSDERWLGGVAAGVAESLGLDPVLVRVGLVVLGLLGGAGVLLYALAWLLLPDRTGRIEARAVLEGQVSASAVVALVLLALSVVVPGPWSWWSSSQLVTGGDVAGLVVVAAAITAAVLLVPRVRGARAAAPSAAGAPGTTTTAGVATGVAAAAPGRRGRAVRVRSRRPVSGALTCAVLGLALLVGAGTWLLLTSPGSGSAWLGSVAPGALGTTAAGAASVAAGLLVVGAAVVAAGLAGRSSGALGSWGVLAALAAVALALAAHSGSTRLAGEVTWRPTSQAAAERGYSLGAGSAVLDLRGLPPAATAGRYTVPVRQGFGDLTVRVAPDAAVSVHGRMLAGQVVPGQGWDTRGSASGVLPDATLVPDGAAAGAGSTPGARPARVVVDVEVLFGQVRLERVAA
jgi:phage shock protein PspC (stress-responsive transcriptional regulator)